MKRYSKDPFWFTAKYPGYCAKCKSPFKAGARVFYYPSSHTTYSGECAEDAAADFSCHSFDESMGG